MLAIDGCGRLMHRLALRPILGIRRVLATFRTTGDYLPLDPERRYELIKADRQARQAAGDELIAS
jgi:hypothetical protein